jgi:electron transfer flavoprotein alpha subunit
MSKTILVFAERRDGQIKRPGLEAVAAARRLAGEGRVEVLALGPGAGADAALVGSYGADKLQAIEADHAEHYAPELYAAAVADAAERSGAWLVLLAATAMGKDLGARAAARLKTACASDLVEIDLQGDGIRGKRPVYSGKAIATVSITGARVAVATLRPNVFTLPEPDAGREAELEPLDAPLAADALRVRAVRLERPEQQERDVAEAATVVAGGRGLKEPENFSLVRELAGLLDGAVGASRAVVDSGWIAHAHQVGQTGKVVSPNLYIACGISGAVQHLAGMSSSKVIVAINKDAEAPIFKVADYGIVGDLFEVLPALTQAVRELKGA